MVDTLGVVHNTAGQETFLRYPREASARLDDRLYLVAHLLAVLLAPSGQAASPEVLRAVAIRF
ncbi:MAG: hypothetical protein HYY04_16525 [Chloroflexi bacterium]|nr:hypothetical protein [Chloroflexota bacterium]